MIKLPNPRWTQTNTSDKFGTVAYSENLNFDEEGYVRLSPRSIRLYDESNDNDFDVAVAIGRSSRGSYLIAGVDEPFTAAVSETAITIAEDAGSGNPNMTTNSHAKWWQNRWYASGATTVGYRTSSSDTWTTPITGLTSDVRHYLEVFASRQTLCVTSGNVIKQYDTSHVASTDLTIPADYEAIGLAYNNSRLAIITRFGSTSSGQNSDSRLYIWDGSTTGATSDFAIGADAAVAVCAYKSSFAVLTRAGQLLYFNGGGFEELASFPFYNSNKQWGRILSNNCFGDSMIASGDRIFLNIGLQLNSFGRDEAEYAIECPSGVWCFDPKVGLYHRYSPSISPAYLVTVAAGGTDASTNILTAASGTIPATGGIARFTDAVGTDIGGLAQNHDYYVIKLSASTFKLAETRELSIAGAAIDITSAASDTSYFWMYDIIDFGQTLLEDAGAVAFVGQPTPISSDIIFGLECYDTITSDTQVLCQSDPFLENRGTLVTAKKFADKKTDVHQEIHIKFAPLGENDSIILKVRGRDLYGLPVSSPNHTATPHAEWVGSREFYTTTDLSAAVTALSESEELEFKTIAGAGAGQTVTISSITEEDGTYSVVLEEDLIGVSGGLRSYFVINNWKYVGTIDSSNNRDGFKNFKPELKTKWLQAKAELRGNGIKLEEFDIVSVPNK